MLTVPAPLPQLRPPVPPTPAGIDLVTRRKTGPQRWWCGACHGSAVTPAAGEPVPGWIEVRADGALLAQACSVEHLAKLLPQIQDKLAGCPWSRPEPSANGDISRLMREVPTGGYRAG